LQLAFAASFAEEGSGDWSITSSQTSRAAALTALVSPLAAFEQAASSFSLAP